jgi:hypothetical protein
MNTSEPTQDLFIVRITQLGSLAAPTVWRGSVRHVPSGLRLYFASFKDLDDFIALRLNVAGQPAQAYQPDFTSQLSTATSPKD